MTKYESNSIDIRRFVEQGDTYLAMEIIASAVEEAYKRGAYDRMATPHPDIQGKPVWLEGLDIKIETQLPTIASLYAKEHGFKL